MSGADSTIDDGSGHRLGLLSARPRLPAQDPLPAGLHPIPGDGRALLLVPPGLPDVPVPLVVFLHGSGGDPVRSLPVLQQAAETTGFLLLVPGSASYTWDAVLGRFGPDVSGIDRALAFVFDRFPVDPERVVLSGFSDGASSALSLGLPNGELVRRILAYSPGFVVPGPREGRPSIFISHGRNDEVLPIRRCSRVIVPLLQAEGYDVDYREFGDGHVVPEDQVAASLAFLTEDSAA